MEGRDAKRREEKGREGKEGKGREKKGREGDKGRKGRKERKVETRKEKKKGKDRKEMKERTEMKQMKGRKGRKESKGGTKEFSAFLDSTEKFTDCEAVKLISFIFISEKFKQLSNGHENSEKFALRRKITSILEKEGKNY